jgi:hypothetical protein
MPKTTHAEPLAILISDLHLSHTPPLARQKEEYWYGVMKRYLTDLKDFQEKMGHIPIFCAGDIFDKWNPSPELVNFAIEHLPVMYCVPGQHDLPYHNYEDIGRSAYKTLVLAGKIIDLKPFQISDLSVCGNILSVIGVPWGHGLPSCEREKGCTHLAIVHAYIWKAGKGYPGATSISNINTWRNQTNADTYDCVLFGDNHKGFLAPGTPGKKATIFNHGAFFRRTMDERDYKSQCGVLYSDGRVLLHPWDRKLDRISDPFKITLETEHGSVDLTDFIEDLRKAKGESLDFYKALLQYAVTQNIDPNIRRILLEAKEYESRTTEKKN